MNLTNKGDGSFGVEPDVIDLLVLHRTIADCVASGGFGVNGVEADAVSAGLKTAVAEKLAAMGFADTDAAIRQLEFAARKIAKEHHAALQAWQIIGRGRR